MCNGVANLGNLKGIVKNQVKTVTANVIGKKDNLKGTVKTTVKKNPGKGNVIIGPPNEENVIDVKVKVKNDKGKQGFKLVDINELEDPDWEVDSTPPEIIPFTAEPGLLINEENRPQTPLQFFQLFVPREILEFMVKETNQYAYYCKSNNFKKCTSDFRNVTIDEMAKYLGLRILMAIFRLPEERMHWSVTKEYHNPIFNQTMPFNRYQSISKYFHTFNREAVPHDNKDKLIIVRTVMDFIRKQCYSVYQPDQNLSLDEGTLPHFGLLSIKVYNKNKPNKYGIKFYMICEAKTGYVLDWITYVGDSKPLSVTVYELVGRFFGKGYRLWMDNFYNSPELTDSLYENRVHTCGTMRVTRVGTPAIIKHYAESKPKMARNTFHYRRKGNTFILLWQDIKPVVMITNIHGPEMFSKEVTKRVRCTRGPNKGLYGAEKNTVDPPIAVHDYNQYMSGVDIFDQKISYYSMARRSSKWTKKL